METDFNRLLQTSKAVDEKLKDMSATDDLLQQMQLQLRKVGEAMAESEERYRRIEKKNEILDATSDGIDRNFRDLQESEKTLKKVDTELVRIADEQDFLRDSIEKLAGESEKAQKAADQVSLLDTTLLEIEDRIQDMQKAREWIARANTRLEELTREIQENARIVKPERDSKRRKTSAVPDDDISRSSLDITARENIVKLYQKEGWTVQQIAKAYRISVTEVELLIELWSKL
jgi:uncharacterized protein YdcH (DUF465 family)